MHSRRCNSNAPPRTTLATTMQSADSGLVFLGLTSMNIQAEASEQKAGAIVPCTSLQSCAPGPRQPRRSNLWIVARLLPKTRKRAFIVGKMQASGGIGRAQVTPPPSWPLRIEMRATGGRVVARYRHGWATVMRCCYLGKQQRFMPLGTAQYWGYGKAEKGQALSAQRVSQSRLANNRARYGKSIRF